MTFLLLWLRHEFRVRWRGLAVLALLVAFSTATVLAALAAARRGESALDRLRAVTLPADVKVLNQDPEFDWDLVRRLPGVAAVAPLLTSALYVEGVELGWTSSAPAGAGIWQGIEQPILLDGRLPDPARADEVAALPRFMERYGKHVGDTITIILNRPQDVDLLLEAGETGSARIRARGPRVSARIVGVIRSPLFADPSDGEAVIIPSPGLFTRYRANLTGTRNLSFSSGLVRLEDGAAGVADFRRRLAEATGPPDIKIDDLSVRHDESNRLLAYEAAVLRVFALAALAAAIVMIAQFTARLTELSRAELRALRAAGLGPRRTAAAAAAGPAAAVPGALLGTATAAVASAWLPIGAAAAFEAHPGLDVDWLVLAPALLIVPPRDRRWLRLVRAARDGSPAD
ncbi:ABC transporter permease [Acrocarpospora sp. B8E8]|uniref:ABC transporter permease n=1 Tax=Acrocarpospora sp. B8E8 TaxID=3153572 RepID=UPI00325F1508